MRIRCHIGFLFTLMVGWGAPGCFISQAQISSPQAVDPALRDRIVQLSGEIWRARYRGADQDGREAAKRELVAIDGHAEILAERFESKRQIVGYETRRLQFFGILSEIRSAESVIVLARYLDDFDDALPERQAKAMLESGSHLSDVPPNAVMAVEALSMMNLSGAPAAKRRGSYSRADVPIWKDWISSLGEDDIEGLFDAK